MSETQAPFRRGDRVMNTGNRNRKTIGIITRVIDAEFCEVLWSDGESYVFPGTIRRDGAVQYCANLPGHEQDRIVRVKLSVRIAEEV